MCSLRELCDQERRVRRNVQGPALLYTPPLSSPLTLSPPSNRPTLFAANTRSGFVPAFAALLTTSAA
jgi:hypothetical protein